MALTRSALSTENGQISSSAKSAQAPSRAVKFSPSLLLKLSFQSRAILFSVVLLIELLWLTVRFDSQTLSESAELTQLLKFAPRAAQLVIAMLAMSCLAGRTRLRRHWTEFSCHARQDIEWPHWLFFHFISYRLWLLTSSWLFEGDTLQPPLAGIVTLEWTLLAAATMICWMGSIAPLRLWKSLLLSEKKFLFLGLLAGTGSLLVSSTSQSLWEPLSDATLAIVVLILDCCFSDVVINSSLRLVGTSTFSVEIAPQCSGYEGVGLLLIFLSLFFVIFRDRLRFPQAWFLMPVGITAIWLGNSLRIAVLIAVGTLVSPSIAMGAFHSQAGWIFFNTISLALAWVALQAPFFSRTEQTRRTTSFQIPSIPYLAPFLILLALNLVLATFVSEFDWMYPIKIAGTCLALAVCAPAQGYSSLLCMPVRFRSRQVRFSAILSSFVPAVLTGLLVFLIWVPLVWNATQGVNHQIPEALTNSSSLLALLWIWARVIGSVVVIPLVEELAFRGYLMRRLCSDHFERLPYSAAPWWTVLASSLLFGLMHQAWFAGTLAGLVYALVCRRRNSLMDAIVAHGVTNGLIAAMVLTCDAWWLW